MANAEHGTKDYLEATLDAKFSSFATQLDKRFDAIDQRFETVDNRFHAMDLRLQGMITAIAKRFDRVDTELGAVKEMLVHRKELENVVRELDKQGIHLDAGQIFVA